MQIIVGKDHDGCWKDACGENFYCEAVVNGIAVCACIDGFVQRGPEDSRFCQGRFLSQQLSTTIYY